LACAAGLDLGLPSATFFTRSRHQGGVMLAPDLRLGVLVRQFAGRRTTFGICFPAHAADELVVTGPIFAASRRANHQVALLLTRVASMRSDASLEVLSPSALSGPRRAARSGHAADNPASAFHSPLVVRASAAWSTIGAALAVFRSANAMRCSSMCGRRGLLPRKARRVVAAAKRGQCKSRSSLVARAGIDR
jgi:hypothetical protein